MIKTIKDKTSFFRFENLSKYQEIVNFVSSVENGNMAFSSGASDDVLNNLKKFCDTFDVSLGQCVFAEQVHSSSVGIVDEHTKLNLNEHGLNLFMGVDTLVTKDKKRCLIIKTADCVPMIIYDSENKVVSVVHAGWRGTLDNIVGKTINIMKFKFASNPENLKVGLGPSIGPEDFLVKANVQEKFKKAGYKNYIKYVSEDQWLLDLWGINKKQLTDLGVLNNNIELSQISTYSSKDFYSFRKKKPSGHFITGAMLK